MQSVLFLAIYDSFLKIDTILSNPNKLVDAKNKVLTIFGESVLVNTAIITQIKHTIHPIIPHNRLDDVELSAFKASFKI